MAIEKTLVLLKPCTMQRGLAGEIISIFEKKGLQICGMKMMMLTDELLSEHYSHLSEKPFFQRVKDAMMTARGSYCMCFQENIVHASDSAETAAIELKRFFRDEEIIEWEQCYHPFLYANDEF